MNKQIKEPDIEKPDLIMTLILSENQFYEFSHIMKDKGISGGIIIMGKGTVKNATLNILGIKNQKRLIVNILIKKEMASEILDLLSGKLRLENPGHGIAFTRSVITGDRIINNKQYARGGVQNMEETSMLNKLTVIVNRGMAEDVIDITRKAGVKGGTILHGRGTDFGGEKKLFGIGVEPEKELVIVLLSSDLVYKVVDDLSRELKLDIPGNGVLYVEPVLDVRGLVDLQSDNAAVK